jgi:hypothetical protein
VAEQVGKPSGTHQDQHAAQGGGRGGPEVSV